MTSKLVFNPSTSITIGPQSIKTYSISVDNPILGSSAVAGDVFGSLYLSSSYQSGGANIFNHTGSLLGFLPSLSTQTTYVSKFDSSGTYLYSRLVDSGGADQGYYVTCDNVGNMYMGGLYTGSPANIIGVSNLNVMSNIASLPNKGSGAGFVSKFDSNGTYLYSIVIDNSTNQDQVRGITCDPYGNMYVTGLLNGSANIIYVSSSNVASNTGQLPTTSGIAGFVCKFDSSGTYQYARLVDSTGTDTGLSVSCDKSGNMYFAGSYNGSSANIVSVTSSNVSSNIGQLPTSSGSDSFVCKFDSSGNYQYSRIVNGTTSVLGRSVACDQSGNMYLVGEYNGTANIITVSTSNVAVNVASLPTFTSLTAYSSKFSSDGTYRYSIVIDGQGSSEGGYGVSCDINNNMYMCGRNGVTSDINFVNSSNTYTTIGSLPGSGTAFICKFDQNGTYLYSMNVDSDGAELGQGLNCDPAGTVYFTGYYTGIPRLNSSSNTGITTYIGGMPANTGSSNFAVKFRQNGGYFPQTEGNVQWNTRQAGTSDDRIYGMACGPTGNVYTSGYFNSPNLVFYNSNTSSFSSNLTNLGGYDIFTSKYLGTGSVSWVAKAGGTGADLLYSMDVDSTDSVYIVGSTTSAPFNAYHSSGSVFSKSFTSNTGSDAFIVKYNSSGTVQWLTRQGGSGVDVGISVISEKTGSELYMAGYYKSSSLLIYNASGTRFSNILTNSGVQNSYIVNYKSTDGSVYWAAKQGGTGTDQTQKLAYDGNVYITGYTNSPVFTIYHSNGASFSNTLTNVNLNDGYLVKYNSSGVVQWIAGHSGLGDDYATCAVCDSQANVYVAGYSDSGSMNVYNSDTTLFKTIQRIGNFSSSYIIKYNTTGNVQWVAQIGGANISRISDIRCDSSDNIYVTGLFVSGISIFNTNGTVGKTLTGDSTYTAYVAMYDSNGTVKWAAKAAGTGNDYGNALACAPDGVYLGGMYTSNPLTVYSSNGVAFSNTLTFDGVFDGYMVKYS